MFFSPLGNFFIALCIFLLYQERVQSQLKQWHISSSLPPPPFFQPFSPT
jgi:hypothetical protein